MRRLTVAQRIGDVSRGHGRIVTIVLDDTQGYDVEELPKSARVSHIPVAVGARLPNPRRLVVRRPAPAAAAAAATTADPLAHQSVQSTLTPRGPREIAQDGIDDVEGAIHLRR